MGEDEGFAVYDAVWCTDVTRRGWHAARRNSSRVNRRAPFATLSNTRYNASCRTWHAPLAVSGRAVTAKMLRPDLAAAQLPGR